MDRVDDTDMIDHEKELQDTLDALTGPAGEPRPGLLTLTRRMEHEESDQFDVDLTIMDFLAYKATQLVFEWRASSDPHQSDLPSALVTMTAGTWPPSSHQCATRTVADADTQNGGPF